MALQRCLVALFAVSPGSITACGSPLLGIQGSALDALCTWLMAPGCRPGAWCSWCGTRGPGWGPWVERIVPQVVRLGSVMRMVGSWRQCRAACRRASLEAAGHRQRCASAPVPGPQFSPCGSVVASCSCVGSLCNCLICDAPKWSKKCAIDCAKNFFQTFFSRLFYLFYANDFFANFYRMRGLDISRRRF